MYECENCINECICNLCVCCNMNPCICSMKTTDFITNEQLYKNCINKEKLKYFLFEYYNTFKKGNQPWCQIKVDTYSNLFEKIENGEFDNE